MKLLDKIQDRLTGLRMGGDAITLKLEQNARAVEDALLIAERAQEEAEIAQLVKESLVDLELGVEDIGWREMTQGGIWNFSLNGLRKMMTLARLMYLANPLIKRAVTVQELYVWGAGCKIESDANSPEVAEVLSDFFDSEDNAKVIGPAWVEREREQRIDGNTFFALFVNRVTGAVRVRVIPPEHIIDIIHNPEDSKEPWFYRKAIHKDATQSLLGTGLIRDAGQTGEVVFPDINYNPVFKTPTVGQAKVQWDVRIIHVKTGGLSVMKFGMPELFSALAWATAYKKILENFATILAAYARVAMKISRQAGKKGVAASKSKMQTAVDGTSNAVDNNPPTNIASVFLSSGGVDISAVKTAHSTTGPDEARALRSMVAAGTDTPEHFFGDSDVGNFATSETLDRPTELKMISRQTMWAGVMNQMGKYAITCSAIAPEGKLRAAGYTAVVKYNDFAGDTSINVVTTSPKGKSTVFTVKFPKITERSIVDRVRAVVQAVTLGGSSAEGIIPNRKVVCKFLLEAMGIENAQGLLDDMYPGDVLQGFKDPADIMKYDEMRAQGTKELGDAALIKAKKGGPDSSTTTDNG